MFEKNKKKKKMSIDFSLRNYETMVQYASDHSLSSGALLNFLIENFLNLSLETKQMFSEAILEYIDRLDFKTSTAAEVERHFIQKQKQIILNLLDFFTDGTGILEEDIMTKNTMKRIEIKDGYALVPKDWIELTGMQPKNCQYVGVVEVRNASRYNVPHFVFFLEKPINKMNDQDYSYVNRECVKAYPQFQSIIDHQVEPAYDDNHQLVNRELWLAAPTIGYFPIMDFEEEDAGYYPCGAMVYRNEK